MNRFEHRKVLDLLCLAPALVMAFEGAYSLYQTPRYFIVVAAGLTVGAVLASRRVFRSWTIPQKLTVTLFAYWGLGLLLTAPDIFRDATTIPARALGVVLAPIAGPRQILSLPLPLGDFHVVLAFFLFLSMTCSAAVFTLASGKGKGWQWVPAVVLVPVVVSIALGPAPAVPSSHELNSLEATSIGSNRIALRGIVLVLLLLAWLLWRSLSGRKRIGVVAGNRWRWVLFRTVRTLLGLSMVACGITGALLMLPSLSEGMVRQTLRPDAPDKLRQALAVSPLSTYRTYFSNELFRAPIFIVESEGEPDRVRIATMELYDGAVLTTSQNQSGGESGVFGRVPSTIRQVGDEDPISSTLTIGDYEGVWVPLPTPLGKVRFKGEAKTELQDGLFYNRDSATAIQLAEGGLLPGTTYTVDGVDPFVPTPSIATFVPGSKESRVEHIPDAITTWIGDQEQPATGSGLLELINRLRSGGYLSHALVGPAPNQSYDWIDSMPGYLFEPSRAGHSLDRITAMFEQLSAQEFEKGSGEGALGAVGDDEQFAVAAFLIADALGFNARVTLGARLSETFETQGLSHCFGGVCRGGDMAVWLEVQDGATGAWAPIDVTPQHLVHPTPQRKETTDPMHPTRVHPQRVEVVPPPQGDRAPGLQTHSESPEQNSGAANLPRVLRIAAISFLGAALLLLLPLTILGVKALRTHRRKMAPSGHARTLGAWRELESRARDFGHHTPLAATRVEIAHQWASKDATELAQIVDDACFRAPGGGDPNWTDAWVLQVKAATDLSSKVSVWCRWKGRVSVRSFFGPAFQRTRAAHRAGRKRDRRKWD